MGHHLGEELERGLEPGSRDVDADRIRIPAGLGVERRPEPLGRLDQPDGVVPVGPLGQRSGRQDRRPARGGGLVGGAVAQDERRRHERPTGQVRRDDRQAVRELTALERREVVGSRGTRDRAVRDDDRSTAAPRRRSRRYLR